MTSNTTDTTFADNTTRLRMPIFVTPLEADILTWFQLVSRRDDEGRLRIGCPDDPEVLHARWASDSLGCTPDEYAEALERFVNSGIIRQIAHSDATGKTTYVFMVEPDRLWTMPIRRRYSTWVDPTVFDAIESAQHRFRARFLGAAPTRASVAEYLSGLPIDESPGYTETLFGHITSRDLPMNGTQTMWGVCFQEDGADLFLLCHPDFTAYNLNRGHDDDPVEADFRPLPICGVLDALPPLLQRQSPIPNDHSIVDARAPMSPAALFETSDPDRILRACSTDEIVTMYQALDRMKILVAAEEERRAKLSGLNNQLEAAMIAERYAREARERIEQEISALEA